MSTPSRHFLDWKSKVTSEQSTPAHVDFSSSDCRDFIRSFIAMDTIDFQSRCTRGSEADENLAALMTEGDFPISTYTEIQRFTEEERNQIRASLSRVLLPTDSNGRLDVLLPIDVLTSIIQNVGESRLFSGNDCDEAFPESTNQLPKWYIDKAFTNTIPAFVLCSGIDGWLRNARIAPLYRAAIARQRDQVIKTFNNRIVPARITSFLEKRIPDSERLKWS